MKRSWSAILPGIAGLILLLTGCRTPGDLRISAAETIPLPRDAAITDLWQASDLVVDYACRRSGNTASFSGTIDFAGNISDFGYMKRFHLQVFFTDGDGRIIGGGTLYRAAPMQPIETWRFNRNIGLPEGAAAISFGYSGTAGTLGWDPITWDFWSMPHN